MTSFPCKINRLINFGLTILRYSSALRLRPIFVSFWNILLSISYLFPSHICSGIFQWVLYISKQLSHFTTSLSTSLYHLYPVSIYNMDRITILCYNFRHFFFQYHFSYPLYLQRCQLRISSNYIRIMTANAQNLTLYRWFSNCQKCKTKIQLFKIKIISRQSINFHC